MKKALLLLSFSFFLFFISCSKNESIEIKPDEKFLNEADELIKEIFLIEDIEAQRMSFIEFLTPQQKSQAWQIRISQMISENSFNSKQLELLYRLKNNLTPAVYGSSEGQARFINGFFKTWQQEAIQIIGFNTLFKYLTALNTENIQNANDQGGESGNFVEASCNCNQTSAFSCLGRDDECKNLTSCTATRGGCGFAWAYSCDGRCTLQ